jgi:transposase
VAQINKHRCTSNLCDYRSKGAISQILRTNTNSAQVHSFFHRHQACLVALEACATSHYWAREIEKCGHTVKLIPPEHVKAFLIGNKNDFNDAFAITVAARQAHIKSVGVKSVEQQDN